MISKQNGNSPRDPPDAVAEAFPGRVVGRNRRDDVLETSDPPGGRYRARSLGVPTGRWTMRRRDFHAHGHIPATRKASTGGPSSSACSTRCGLRHARPARRRPRVAAQALSPTRPLVMLCPHADDGAITAACLLHEYAVRRGLPVIEVLVFAGERNVDAPWLNDQKKVSVRESEFRLECDVLGAEAVCWDLDAYRSPGLPALGRRHRQDRRLVRRAAAGRRDRPPGHRRPPGPPDDPRPGRHRPARAPAWPTPWS